MSQIVTRKGPVGEDKEKRQTDSPVKEMKKKLAANAEKDKQAAEKSAEKPQMDKKTDKATEKPQIDKKVEKVNEKPQNEKKSETVAEKPQTEKKTEKVIEKIADKSDKKEKTDKSVDKKDKLDKSVDKNVDKKDKIDKGSEKKEAAADKKESDSKATEKKEKLSDKKETPQPEKAKEDPAKDKAGKAEAEPPRPRPSRENGVNGDATNGDTVSSEEEDDERDEMFPELAYDDSDGDFEPPTPEGRSYTRRSQVKSARTPETPRPASDRRERDDDSKVLKLKEDTPASDRKLRSSGSPKPERKRNDTRTIPEEGRDSEIVVNVEVVNVENEERVKSDTNYSRSRVKVSPYRRLHQPDDSSLLADYTGNNSTMEMDITESSWPEGSPYLSGLRAIRGRRSYKTLGDHRRHAWTHATAASEVPSRPTGTVVGRKRKPDAAGGSAPGPAPGPEPETEAPKRPRLLDRLARPFRLSARREAEIVGINTDLPLSAPVSSLEPFDPEALKCDAPGPPGPSGPPRDADRDAKRCVVM